MLGYVVSKNSLYKNPHEEPKEYIFKSAHFIPFLDINNLRRFISDFLGQPLGLIQKGAASM